MSTKAPNTFESRVGRITLQGDAHGFSAVFVVLLRLLMGGMILLAGLGKYAWVPGGEAFNAEGFLLHGVDSVSPVSGLYAAMAGNEMMLATINVIIPATQVLIGIALITGAFVRLAAFGGALQMFAFYLGGWEGQWLALFDNTLIYAVLFLALGALAAGRIAGLDRYIERLNVGGQPLTERFPKLNYVLG